MFMRELQWVIDCDENGVKTEPVLEYKDGKFGYWESVPTVERKIIKNKRGEKDVKIS